jgi:amino acid transporter
MNLSEETKDAKVGPAKGASFAMLALVALFVLFIAALILSLSQIEITDAGSNIVFAITQKLFPGPLGVLAVVAVFLSGIGAIETQILQFTRTVFSMSRAKALSPHFAHLHVRWNTPWLATLLIWLLGTVLLLVSSYADNVSRVMLASVNAICFQVAFYYGLTGLACAWHYLRRTHGFGDFILKVLWPGLSALFLFGIGLYSMSTFDNLTIGIGVGGVLLGFIPMTVRKYIK